MSNNYRDGGKGDMPRPILNQEQFDKSWEEIFGKKPVKTLKDYIEQKGNDDGTKTKASTEKENNS